MCNSNDMMFVLYINKVSKVILVVMSLLAGLAFSFLVGLSISLISEPAFAEVDVHPRRLIVWEKFGADQEVMDITISRIERQGNDGEGSWIYEWDLVGNHYSALAKLKESEQEFEAAKKAYLTASVYYAIAKFPENSTVAQRKVYQKHLDAYKSAGKYFDPPLKVIQIPSTTSHITAYLHLPEAVERPPLVLWANGMDTHKAEIRNLFAPLLNRGIAVATFDVPGTGESMPWTGSTSTDLHDRLFKYFSNSDLVDGENISTVGVSFAGYYASKWAFTNHDLKSAVILCGVTHTPFSWDVKTFSAIPSDVANTMAQVMGVTHGDWDALALKSKEYDLFQEDFLESGSKTETPILLINGDQDPFAPLADLERYGNFASEKDIWILGGDGHCAPAYLEAYLPKMADWIAARFDKQ